MGGLSLTGLPWIRDAEWENHAFYRFLCRGIEFSGLFTSTKCTLNRSIFNTSKMHKWKSKVSVNKYETTGHFFEMHF